ncbi:MAG: hypothetical protein ABW189_08475 [Rickettsiales bacterium]
MTAQQEIRELKEEIDRLKNLLVDHAEKTASNGMSKMIFTKDEICDMARNAGSEVRNYFGEKQRQISDATASCKETIRERPFTSTAIAFATGALLASLFRRN